MQSPRASKPHTLLEGLLKSCPGLNVFQISQTNLSFLIPGKHRIDRLRKLSAASFIDAAGVDPDILNAVFFGDLTRTVEFLVAFLLDIGPVFGEVLECQFFVGPSMRQYRVRWDLSLDELLELEPVNVDEAQV